MLPLHDELAMLPLFSRVLPSAVRASAPLWTLRELDAGQQLWAAGSAVDELGVLLSGDLRARVNEAEVGRIHPGELIGEASAFFDGATRSAQLAAAARSKVAVLKVSGLRTLRRQRSALYLAMLDGALTTLARRVHTVNQRIAGVAAGREAAPVRTEPALLARMWRALVPTASPGPCPPIAPLLAALPGLGGAGPEVLQALAAAFVAEPMEEGRPLFLEGEPASSAFLIAEGSIDVLRNVRGDRAERLATLKSGDLIGVNTLILPGPRTASCVPVSRGWLYRLNTAAYEDLTGDARLWWRESMLSSLTTQIRLSNSAMRRDAGRVAPAGPTAGPAPAAREAADAGGDDFQSLLRASGFLEGLPMNEAALDDIEVVISDDQKRNPRRR